MELIEILTSAGLLVTILTVFIKFRIDIAEHKTYVDMKIKEIEKEFRRHERMNEVQFENYHKDVGIFKKEVKEDFEKLSKEIKEDNGKIYDVLWKLNEKIAN
jgi:hypothetical protein